MTVSLNSFPEGGDLKENRQNLEALWFLLLEDLKSGKKNEDQVQANLATSKTIIAELCPSFVDLNCQRLQQLSAKLAKLPPKEQIQPESLLDFAPIWPLLVNLCAAMACLGLSSTYHTCSHHSEKLMKVTLSFDYAGIAILIFGTSIAPITYAFACGDAAALGFWMGLFMLLICAAAFFTAVLPATNKPGWNMFRGVMWIVCGGAGLIPLTVLAFYQPTSQVIQFSPLYILLGGAFYIGGAILYGKHFPECTAPGKYDLFGTSHQIFHVCVLFGAAIHFYSNLLLYESRQTFTCAS